MVAYGVVNKIDDGRCVDFQHYSRPVGFNSFQADSQNRCDFPVRFTYGKKPEHLLLAWGKDDCFPIHFGTLGRMRFLQMERLTVVAWVCLNRRNGLISKYRT